VKYGRRPGETLIYSVEALVHRFAHFIKRRFDMLGVFAEFETNLRRERQLEGIAKAKAEGIYKDRKPSIDVARVKGLH
jgi:DNA invertase Pin-like site-specific DNA recombinase